MKKPVDMTDEEYGRHLKEIERKHTASVGDFIAFLEKHYKPTDKLCHIDCIEGYKYEAQKLLHKDLGDTLFRYIRDEKADARKHGASDSELEREYPYVENSYILIV